MTTRALWMNFVRNLTNVPLIQITCTYLFWLESLNFFFYLEIIQKVNSYIWSLDFVSSEVSVKVYPEPSQ